MIKLTRPGAACALLLTAGALTLSACGASSSNSNSSSGSGSGSGAAGGGGGSSSSSTAQSSNAAATTAASGIAHAQAQVRKYSAPTGIPKAGPPVKGVASLKGKRIWFVPQSTEIPYFAAVVTGAKAAAAAAGLDIRVCDGQNTPATMSACVSQATTGGGAGVVGDGIQVGQVQQAVNALGAKGIPFVQGDLTQAPGNDKIAYAWNNSFLQSVLAADAIIADTHGKANILIVRHTDSPSTEAFMDQGGLKELKTYCPGCQVTIIQTNAVQLSQLTSEVSSALEKNPDTDAIFAEFDLDVPSVVSSLQSLNKNLKIYSTTAQLSGLQRVKKGSYEVADAGTDPAYMGWAAVDQLIRMMLHATPNTRVPMPVRLFTKSNIGSVNLTNADFVSGSWYGATGFEQMFRKLWGVS